MVFRVAHISDLMDTQVLNKMRDQGYIGVQHHPSLNLRIYNYTRKAQFERMWNEATRQCRGLIVDEHGMVVARPFPKFFNLGEMDDDEIPNEPFEVFDKMDGSLGILYPDSFGPGGYAIATRGSFVSEQAAWATQFLVTYMAESSWTEPFQPKGDSTYLFEIIYPENRIVVDYGGTRTLVLLDVIDNETGESVLGEVEGTYFWRKSRWPGNVVRGYTNLKTLQQVTSVPDPGNAEGFVIRWAHGTRAKFKFDEYVRLHRIVTNVSTRTVWEWLAEGKPLEDLLEGTPDEFDNWVNETAREITLAAAVLSDEIYGVYQDMLERLNGHPAERKAFAHEAVKSEHRAALFQIYDGQHPTAYIWQQVKPQFSKAFTNDEES